MSFEIKCGITIAIFAAIMSISDLYAGKYGDDEILLTNEKSAAYLWYQSKSIKGTLIEEQSSLLQSLKDAGAIKESSLKGVEAHIEKLNNKVTKYEKEKKEILLGSNEVGKDNWIQDVDGKLGAVVGAKEYEAKLAKLSDGGDYFDYASLFYQVSLIFGAISLVLKEEKVQNIFFYFMINIGIVAIGFSFKAFSVIL